MPRPKHFTNWNDTEETFRFLAAQFDIQKAKRILRAKPRKAEVIPVSAVASLIMERDTFTIGVWVDLDLVDSGEGIDLSVPVIVATLEGSHLPIDGWHRLARAKKLGIKELPCVILTKSETKKIRS